MSKVVLTLEFNEEATKRLDAMKNALKAPERQEVLRTALAELEAKLGLTPAKAKTSAVPDCFYSRML